MGLRARVVVMLLAIVVPLVSGYTLYRMALERRNQQARRAERVAGRIQENPTRACRLAMMGGRRRGGRNMPPTFAYDKELAPLGAHAPPLPAAVREEFLASSGAELTHTYLWGEALFGATMVPLQDVRCAAVMIPWEPKKGDGAFDGGVLRVVVPQALMMLLALVGTGLMISIPLVRRIRKLTRDVERAPQQSWKISPGLAQGSDEIAALARAFVRTGERVSETIQELEQRDEALKEYISNTTHDLAIPLTVLQHRLSRLRDRLRAGEPVEPGQVEQALEESHYIAALIANMSAAAKLEAGEEHRIFHEVDLAVLAERVVERNRPIAAQKGVEIDWAAPEDGAMILGDSTLLEQALSNLVQNAVQYNEEGGHVAVVVGMDGERFSVRVLDDGPGVPAEHLEGLTQRRARGSARNRNPGGQGFGLSIASRVCEVHGFELQLRAGEMGGLEVEISGGSKRA